VQTLKDGSMICAPNVCSPSCVDFGGINVCSACLSLPVQPVSSHDPNDKVGSIGAGASQFVRGDRPLSYTIHFENLATATAPAQVVLVTDQLDPQLADLGTLTLGPISFADNTLVPVPGVRGWTGGVDLRPEQNILVTISAGLDTSTGLVTWRFTSVDPDTEQLTDDPNAGFLPPNTAPPTGEGTVTFTVIPKSALATGTAIQNKAIVVFDNNAAIPTPTWQNVVDNDPPVTHVLPLAATQSSPVFVVQWSGTDVGSGVASYRVFASDNGGPFALWLDFTPNLSGIYPGQPGHTYGFFSIGADLVGNVEALKTAAEATTRVGTSSNCASDDSAQVQVTRSGFGYNVATARFVQTVVLKNISAATITGPLSLVLDSLSSNATLYSPAGITACAAPAGDPYVNLSSDLGPGASESITLQFADPSKAGINYTTRVLAGSAGR
jgi:hypothetical protein